MLDRIKHNPEEIKEAYMPETIEKTNIYLSHFSQKIGFFSRALLKLFLTRIQINNAQISMLKQLQEKGVIVFTNKYIRLSENTVNNFGQTQTICLEILHSIFKCLFNHVSHFVGLCLSCDSQDEHCDGGDYVFHSLSSFLIQIYNHFSNPPNIYR